MSNQTPHDPNQPRNFEFDPQRPELGWQPATPLHQKPKKRHTARNIFFAALGTLTVIGVAASLGGSPEPAATRLPGVVTTTAPPKASLAPTQPPKTTAPAPVVETTTEAPVVTQPSMTRSQEQAVGKAESYLDYAAFSHKGLIEQLEYEGFTKADSTYAVSHITVNWNEQAAKKAESYLEMTQFSRSGLIEQLEYEGFTHKQAVYGVSKAGL
jgi:hypothetical protein